MYQGDVCYYVFNDRKVVSFVSNGFPEHMSSKVARTQCNGVFGYQSVPPLLPAYNKFMGAVDLVSQIRKTYGYDRKSNRYWLRLLFAFVDYTVDNAYILYKRDCMARGIPPLSLKDFKDKLGELLMQKSPRKHTNSRRVPEGDRGRVFGCRLSKLSEIGMTRGRCYQCTLKKRQPVHHTCFGCSTCQVRFPVSMTFIRLRTDWELCT